MMPFFRYITRYYVRSYQYIAPLLFFVIASYIVYNDESNDVLGTYSLAAVWVFLVSTWLAYGYSRVEHRTQQQITVINMGSARRYLWIHLGYISLVTSLFACCSVLYPVIAHSVHARITGVDFFVALVESISFALIGVSIGMFFNERFFPKRSSSIIGVIFVSLVSIIGENIVTKYHVHVLQWIVAVVTPVSHTVDAVQHWSSQTGMEQVFTLLWPFVYALILMTLYVKRSLRTLLE